jgi:hypothetical protein
VGSGDMAPCIFKLGTRLELVSSRSGHFGP